MKTTGYRWVRFWGGIGCLLLIALCMSGCITASSLDEAAAAAQIPAYSPEDTIVSPADGDPYTEDLIASEAECFKENHVYKYLAQEITAESGPFCKKGEVYMELLPENPGQKCMAGMGQASAAYKDAWSSGVDWEITFSGQGFYSYGVLQEPMEPNLNLKYAVRLPCAQFELRETGDVVFYTEETDTRLYLSSISSPVLIDAEGKRSVNNRIDSLSIVKGTGKYLIQLGLDQDFLNAETTRYPVRVLQSINLY